MSSDTGTFQQQPETADPWDCHFHTEQDFSLRGTGFTSTQHEQGLYMIRTYYASGGETDMSFHLKLNDAVKLRDALDAWIDAERTYGRG